MAKLSDIVYTEEKVKELLSNHLNKKGIIEELKTNIAPFLNSYEKFYREQIDFLNDNVQIPNQIKEKLISELNEDYALVKSTFTGKGPYRLVMYITHILPKLKNDLQAILSAQEFPENIRKRLHRVTSTLDAIHTSACNELGPTNQKHP